MYAILDIETTGGKYDEEGITEIAIYKYDGKKVVDQFISLVNPEKEIQPFVVNLTGINNAMLRTAPKFYEVAKRIVEITEDCTIVAHNAQFDYRILSTEYRRLGFQFQRKTLCTVELSQKLLPGKESYSLGKLVRSLGIPVSDRHRANGDAQATLRLFKLLIDKDTSKTIIREAVKTNLQQQMAPKLLDIVHQLPTNTGVYYIHREDGEIIYIGKSNNIKRRVNQHFTGSSSKAKRIQREVVAVTYEETGNELIALLKENEEIKQNQPILNRSRKRKLFSFALFSQPNEQGYISFYIDKVSAKNTLTPITTFASIHEAKNILYRLADEFMLCHKFLGLSEARKNCFNYTVKKCNGACISEESIEEYNQRATLAIEKFSFDSQNMILVDHGREIDERSAILIENGVFKGLGYIHLNYQLSNVDILRTLLTPMDDNPDVRHLIQSYLRKRKVLKIVRF